MDGSDVPDHIFINMLNYLKTTYSKKDYLIHIYSQGDIERFKQYEGKNIIFHLDESIEETFTGMVLADVLVTSPSAFSYTAGLLSDGIVYYIPFWHAPLPNWHIIDIVDDEVVIIKTTEAYQSWRNRIKKSSLSTEWPEGWP